VLVRISGGVVAHIRCCCCCGVCHRFEALYLRALAVVWQAFVFVLARGLLGVAYWGFVGGFVVGGSGGFIVLLEKGKYLW